MVGFRIFQGVTAAFIGPLVANGDARHQPAGGRRQGACRVWGMGVMVGPIMGPVIGGWLTESYNWRWVFYVNVPVGALTFAILWFLLPSRPRRHAILRHHRLRDDLDRGRQLQPMLDRGQQADWFLEAGRSSSRR